MYNVFSLFNSFCLSTEVLVAIFFIVGLVTSILAGLSVKRTNRSLMKLNKDFKKAVRTTVDNSDLSDSLKDKMYSEGVMHMNLDELASLCSDDTDEQ